MNDRRCQALRLDITHEVNQCSKLIPGVQSLEEETYCLCYLGRKPAVFLEAELEKAFKNVVEQLECHYMTVEVLQVLIWPDGGPLRFNLFAVVGRLEVIVSKVDVWYVILCCQ